MAGFANQVEVTRLAVGVLEAEPAFAEVDFACDPRVDHPLQRAVHRRPADPMVVAANQIDEIVGAEVTFLPQEHVDDLFPLAGTLAPCGLECPDVWKSRTGHV